MNKKQVKNILINQADRRKTIFNITCVIILISIISLAMWIIYFNEGKTKYVHYNEYSDIDYQVFLKENQFFNNDFLTNKNSYVASLINYLTAKFKYNLTLDKENVDYHYSYRIEAETIVKEKDMDKPLYHSSDILLKEKNKKGNLNKINIQEDIKIDYNHYNQITKTFIQTYGLDNTESILNINMYVDIINSCDDLEQTPNKESVITLSIPLTTKTVGIDISDNLINDNGIMLCQMTTNRNIFLILGVIFSIIDIILTIYIIKYYFETLSLGNLYEREMKKILNRYSSYIQQINSDFNFEGYQILKVNTFEDMLEIRDTVKQPILMKENDNKTGAYFIIPTNTKILYVFRIKVGDVK